MDVCATLLKWQRFDPATGGFDAERTTREYADLLGIDESYLSHIYRGRRRNCPKVISALLLLFPEAANDLRVA